MAITQSRAPQDHTAVTPRTVTKQRQPKAAPISTDRLPVPDELIGLTPELEDERMEILRDYAPECMDNVDSNTGLFKPQSSEWVPFFADPNKNHNKRRLTKLGYEPVMVEGSQLDHRGDLLFKCPRELFTQRKARIGRRSSAQATERIDAQDPVSKAEGFYQD